MLLPSPVAAGPQLHPSAAGSRACACTEPPRDGTGGLAPLGSGRRRAAVTALAYKYLRGGSGFRQSTSVVKIKVFDLLSIYSVKYDLPGPFFPQMSSTPFFLVEVVPFSPNAEQRRCKSLAHTNANQKIPFPATEARRRQRLGDRGCGISEPEDSGWHLGRPRKVVVGSVRGPGGGGGPEPVLGGSPCGQAGLAGPPRLLGGRESVWPFRGLRGGGAVGGWGNKPNTLRFGLTWPSSLLLTRSALETGPGSCPAVPPLSLNILSTRLFNER